MKWGDNSHEDAEFHVRNKIWRRAGSGAGSMIPLTDQRRTGLPDGSDLILHISEASTRIYDNC